MADNANSLAVTRVENATTLKSAARTAVNLTEKQQREIVEEALPAIEAMRRKIELQGYTKDAAAKTLEHEGMGKRSTLLRWWKESAGGRRPNALARKPRADRDKSKFFDCHPWLKKPVIATYVETGGNVSYVRELLERRLPSDCRLPCNNTIRRFIDKNLPPSVLAANRDSKGKWNANHAPYLITGRGAFTPANHTWVGDHRQLDILVADDRPYAPKPLAALRAWHTLIQDMRTRVIVASLVTVQPDSMVLATAMRAGVGMWGIPGLFYCDNGKDFRKFAEKLARLGVPVQHCTPRHPQAKFVESTFSFASKRFDHLFFRHGYTGSKPEWRSEFCREQEKQHADFLAGKRQDTPLYTLSFVSQLLQQWVREYNAEHRHAGRGMNGRTPLEAMNTLLPAAQRTIPDMDALEPLFWDVKTCKVRRGKVELRGFFYSPALDDAKSFEEMNLAGGSEVAVHFDPNDMACALAFENRPSGDFLARLVCDELAAQRPHTHEEIKAMMHHRAKLYKESKRALAAFTAGVPTEIELLAERAQIADQGTGTDGKPRRPAQPRLDSPFVPDVVKQIIGDWDKE
jgi:transposase InsO family protein